MESPKSSSSILVHRPKLAKILNTYTHVDIFMPNFQLYTPRRFIPKTPQEHLGSNAYNYHFSVVIWRRVAQYISSHFFFRISPLIWQPTVPKCIYPNRFGIVSKFSISLIIESSVAIVLSISSWESPNQNCEFDLCCFFTL